MFKSCNYCRHRKKKCALEPWASRCTECEHLDLICEFSRRQPSQKRRQTSQRIASRVSAAAAAAVSTARVNGDHQWASTGSVVSVVKDGDSQLNSADTNYPHGQKIILKDDAPLVFNSTATVYRNYVQPLTPFVPFEMVHEQNENWDPILQQCVELAAGIWLHSMPQADVPQQAGHALKSITQGDMTLPRLTGVLLMILRFPVDGDCIQWVSPWVNHRVFFSSVLTNIRSSALFMHHYLWEKNCQRLLLRAHLSPTPGFDYLARHWSHSTFLNITSWTLRNQ